MDLTPLTPPPQCLRTSWLLLKDAVARSHRDWRSFSSSLFTLVRQTAVAVFLCTNFPTRALDLTIMYGTSFLRQRAGKKHTISIGSTSWALITSLAFLFSTKSTTWLMPYLITFG